MASPSLLDGKNLMAKKVIKASEADEKVEKLTKDKKDGKKNRSAKEIRSKLYGEEKE